MTFDPAYTKATREADLLAAIDRVQDAADAAKARGQWITSDVIRRVRKACDKAVKALEA